jgi:hypothetical protein
MKSWKTTLAGMLAAIANLFLPMVTGGQISGISSRDLAVSAGLAALGYLAKDSNVTGGTVQQ